MVVTKNLLLRSRGADGKAITANARKRVPEADDSSTDSLPPPKRSKSKRSTSKAGYNRAPAPYDEEEEDSKQPARITQDSEENDSDEDEEEDSSDADSIDPSDEGSIEQVPPANATKGKNSQTTATKARSTKRQLAKAQTAKPRDEGSIDKVPKANATKGTKRHTATARTAKPHDEGSIDQVPTANATKGTQRHTAKATKPRKGKRSNNVATTKDAPTSKTVTPPTDEEKQADPPPDIDKLLELTRNLQRTIQSQVQMQGLLLQQQQANTTANTTKKDLPDSDEDEAPKPNKQWTTHKEAKFCAWAGVCLESEHLPNFFQTVACARADDKHGLIMGKFESLRQRFQEFVDFEPSQDLIDDIKKLALAPVVSATKWHRGLGPMAFADRDYTELEEERAQRDRLEASPGLRLSLADIKAMESGPPPTPKSSEKALKYLQRWKIFIRETLGERSALTSVARVACSRLLKLQRRIKRAPTFVTHRLPSILWDLTDTTSTFFNEIVPPSQFLDAEDNDEDPPSVDAYFDSSAAFSFSAGPNSDLPHYLLPIDDIPNPVTPKKVPRSNPQHQERRDKDPKGTQLNDSWHPDFEKLLKQAKLDPAQVVLTKWLDAADKKLPWLSSALGLDKTDCLKFHSLGRCKGRYCDRQHNPRQLENIKVTAVLGTLGPHASPAILPRQN